MWKLFLAIAVLIALGALLGVVVVRAFRTLAKSVWPQS